MNRSAFASTAADRPAAETRAARRHRLQRRSCIALALAAVAAPLAAAAPPTLVEVWKSPTCGCCNDGIAQLREAGFAVRTVDSGNVAMRKALGMPERLGSCHTARVDGYILEGHVPVQDIRRLLAQRPRALGLAVPGMPIGSPGMDGPAYAGRRDPYDVLLVQRDGSTGVWRAVR